MKFQNTAYTKFQENKKHFYNQNHTVKCAVGQEKKSECLQNSQMVNTLTQNGGMPSEFSAKENYLHRECYQAKSSWKTKINKNGFTNVRL